MDFYLQIFTPEIDRFQPILNVVESKAALRPSDNQLFIIGNDNHTRIEAMQHNNKYAWLIGDPIIEKDKYALLQQYLGEVNITAMLQSVNGHYRMIIYDSDLNTLHVTSSLFGILPVFYCTGQDRVMISSDVTLIAENADFHEVNKRFILENILFYYPLFNQTAYKNIYLLPSHNAIKVSRNGQMLNKHTTITDWFVSSPEPWEKATERISDIFIDRVKNYLPDEQYMHALTGGFDSRTLVSCGLYYNKKFETYSFGNENSYDTSIAATLSARAGVNYNYIHLNEDYIKNHSLKNGLEFIWNSAGNAGFPRAHYLYAARIIAARSKYVVTGNFGSEILRAAHNAGEVFSTNLYHLFHSGSFGEAIKNIESSNEFSWINTENYFNEWEELKAEISTMPVFDPAFADFSLNAKFYTFIFEETFRKYFGAEMVNQFKYINNRTPFLDTTFLKEILKTGLAGVYSDFFEHNPLKRFKGQLLYAFFIKKAYPEFSEHITEKGYRPADLLSFTGKMRIATSYFRKKLHNPDTNSDQHCVAGSFLYNQSFYQQIPENEYYFNVNNFKNAFHEKKFTKDFYIALSQAWFVEKLNEKTMQSHLIK